MEGDIFVQSQAGNVRIEYTISLNLSPIENSTGDGEI